MSSAQDFGNKSGEPCEPASFCFESFQDMAKGGGCRQSMAPRAEEMEQKVWGEQGAVVCRAEYKREKPGELQGVCCESLAGTDPCRQVRKPQGQGKNHPKGLEGTGLGIVNTPNDQTRRNHRALGRELRKIRSGNNQLETEQCFTSV